jgi:hypothetical protein
MVIQDALFVTLVNLVKVLPFVTLAVTFLRRVCDTIANAEGFITRSLYLCIGTG